MEEELDMVISSELKSVAVAQDLIPALFCENELIEKSEAEAVKGKSVDKAAMVDSVRARELAASFMPSDSAKDGETIKAVECI